jgi:oligopeptide/dipeptide ABC transporter ATP-binding protein
VKSGETLCIVGESGSGKSTLALAISMSLPPNAVIERGDIIYSDISLIRSDKKLIDKIKGRDITMIFQDPFATFSPLHTIGEHLLDIAQYKLGIDRKNAQELINNVLRKVGFTDIERVLRSYPHEMSGGMLQRAAIAASLLVKPKILVADEPTTMLDATIQYQIINLLKNIVDSEGLTLILVTHNLGIASMICERTMVMYAGVIVEDGETRDIIREPLHPYTRGLIDSIPRTSHYKSRVKPIPGEPLDPRIQIQGCPFFNRCPYAVDDCLKNVGYTIYHNRKIYCRLYR